MCIMSLDIAFANAFTEISNRHDPVEVIVVNFDLTNFSASSHFSKTCANLTFFALCKPKQTLRSVSRMVS